LLNFKILKKLAGEMFKIEQKCKIILKKTWDEFSERLERCIRIFFLKELVKKVSQSPILKTRKLVWRISRSAEILSLLAGYCSGYICRCLFAMLQDVGMWSFLDCSHMSYCNSCDCSGMNY